MGQLEPFATIAKTLRGIPLPRHRQTGTVTHFKGRAIFHHEHEFAWSKTGDGSCNEVKINAFGKAHLAEIQGDRFADILKLEILQSLHSPRQLSDFPDDT